MKSFLKKSEDIGVESVNIDVSVCWNSSWIDCEIESCWIVQSVIAYMLFSLSSELCMSQW